jgi:hypothetical protein
MHANCLKKQFVPIKADYLDFSSLLANFSTRNQAAGKKDSPKPIRMIFIVKIV